MRKTAALAILAAIIGALIILLGIVVMAMAPHEKFLRWGTPTVDHLLIYYDWELNRLVAGTELALLGMAVLSASLTCLWIERTRTQE